MAFVTTWTTTGVDETITIPCGDIGTYNATIDWGDSSPDSTITTFDDADLTHTYAVAGTYTVSITGTLPWVRFNNGGDKLKIKSIEEWGDVGVLSGDDAYFGCANLVGNATDTPDMSNVTIMSSMFRGCTIFNGDISGWDLSGVTTTNAMLRDCTLFNQAIGSWDVSSVEDMSYMFYGAWAFNKDISGWNVGAVQNMSNMFRIAVAFNQDIGAWDVSSVTDTQSMFHTATDFDQNICGWDITSVQNMSNMFVSVTLSTSNYDKMLIAWAALDVIDGTNFHGGNSVYCFGATARASLVADQTWTITDGGAGAGPCVDPGPCASADFHMYKTDRIADGVGPVEASQLQGVLVR